MQPPGSQPPHWPQQPGPWQGGQMPPQGPPPGQAPGLGPQGPYGRPPKKRSGGKTVGIVVGALAGVALLVTGGIGAVGMLTGGGSESTPGGSAAANPAFPLAPTSGLQAKYGDVVAPNACNVIPLDLLSQRGFQFTKHGAILEALPDPYSPSAPVPQVSMDEQQGMSSCLVDFADGGRVSVDVMKAPYNQPSELRITDSMRSGAQPPIHHEGWEILVENDGDYVTGTLQHGDTLANIDFSAPHGQQGPEVESLAREVFTNVASRLNAPPAPVNEANYAEPYGKVPDPCGAFTAQDFQSLTGTTDSGVVQRRWSNGEDALVELGPDVGRFADVRCARASLQPDAFAKGARSELEMWVMPSEPIAAQAMNQYQTSGTMINKVAGPVRVLPGSVAGSPVLAYTDKVNNQTKYLARAGRYILQFHAPAATPDDAVAAKYNPVAESIASRLNR